MSLIFATQLTAIATAMLAVFAVVTAVYAIRAFRKQAQEVGAIERQVKDQQELTRQQARLLEIQFDQLDIQRKQFADQREANAREAKVFELQYIELSGSIAQRTSEEEERRRGLASRVCIREDRHTGLKAGRERVLPYIKATVLNTSDQPVYDLELRWQCGSTKHDDQGPEPLGMILPAAEASGSREFPSDAEMVASSAVLTFRDAAGVIWICRPDGTLRDKAAERRASASLPRRAAGRLTRELHDLVGDYLAHRPVTPPRGPASPDAPEPE